MAVAGFNPLLEFMSLVELTPLLLLGVVLLGSVFLFSSGNRTGPNPILRIIWFFTFGWWLGLIWIGLSLILIASIIFIPVGIWALTKTWKIMTLAGSEGPRDAVSDISVDVENKIEQEVESSSSSKSNEKDNDIDTKERLQELKDLKEDGMLTEKEFREKKKEILDEI